MHVTKDVIQKTRYIQWSGFFQFNSLSSVHIFKTYFVPAWLIFRDNYCTQNYFRYNNNRIAWLSFHLFENTLFQEGSSRVTFNCL